MLSPNFSLDGELKEWISRANAGDSRTNPIRSGSARVNLYINEVRRKGRAQPHVANAIRSLCFL